MKTKLLAIFVALLTTCSLWAGNTITYTATSKLIESTSINSSALYKYGFNVSITSHTFSNGTGTISFSGEVTRIGVCAFQYCSDLTSITIPNSVTSIGDCAFRYCSGLTSITIPNSVTSIGTSAFSDCSGLTSITIPNSVTSIGGGAFYNCSGLTSITIPDGVTIIGDYAFYYCSGLTSITIPDGVTSIGDYAFYYCSGLTSITIPNSVTSIGKWAFSGCSGLTSITCEAIVPPTCGNWVFGYVDKSIPLYVPQGSISAYKAAYGWKDFTNYQIITGVEEVLQRTSDKDSKIMVDGKILLRRGNNLYDLNGRKF